ncbi:MAG TPA: FAD-binding oxidoreductase [Anaerolineae bacterium]
MLDQLVPRETLRPATVEELASHITSLSAVALRSFNAGLSPTPIIPRGGGTQQHLGNFPRVESDKFVAVDTTRLDRVIEYSPDDMIITVECGMTVGAVQTVLREHDQFLPLDVPFPARATVGGSLAVGRNAAHRLRYGPPRDFTLGIQVVNADGAITKAGARTVKNVAGYELHKMYVGSYGTLAILTRATFKIFPLPQATSTLVVSVDNPDVQSRALELWNLANPPSALALASANLAGRFGLHATKDWLLFVRFAGPKKSVEQGVRQVQFEEIISEDNFLWQTAPEIPHTLHVAHPTGIVLRIRAPISNLRALLSTLESLTTTFQFPFSDVHVFGYPANSDLVVAFSAEATPAIEFIKRLRAAGTRLGAVIAIDYAPGEIKVALDAWGDTGQSFPLMRSLKDKFDPLHILNPGRFVGGL